MKLNSMTKSAFTLAEVLITLAIVGVIAALTIPSLVTSIGNAQVITAWKSNYADLSQAASMVMNDGGGSITAYGTAAAARDAFATRMNFVKSCGNTMVSQAGNCWDSAPKNFAGGATPLALITPQDDVTSSAVTAGGSLVMFNITGGADPLSAAVSMTCLANGSTPCSDVFIDVNGFTGPNQLGKDIFKASIYANKIGFSEASFGCGAAMGTGDTLGTGCGKYYLTRSS